MFLLSKIIYMNYIINLLSPKSKNSMQMRLRSLSWAVGLEGKGNLVSDYPTRIVTTIKATHDGHRLVRALLERAGTCDSIEQCVKALTLVHTALIAHRYNEQVLSSLQDVQQILSRGWQLPIAQKHSWFLQFFKIYIKYLGKLPSMVDILVDSMKGLQPTIQYSLNHQFRITNLLNSILPNLIEGFNTVGRYWKKELTIFEQLHKVIKGEMARIYEYLGQIFRCVLRDFRKLRIEEQRMWMGAVGATEICLDRMEEFLTCKYYQTGAKIKQYYSFSASSLAQANYYMEQAEKKQKEFSIQ